MSQVRWFYTSAFQARSAAFFGRRGTFLVAYGIMWMIIGFANFVDPQERFSRPGPGGPLEILERSWVGLFWLTCGLIAIITAFVRRLPGRHLWDQWGFMALMLPALLWDLAFLWSWVSWLTTAEWGRPTAWLGVLTYLVVVFSILIVAGWPDPADEEVIDLRGTE